MTALLRWLATALARSAPAAAGTLRWRGGQLSAIIAGVIGAAFLALLAPAPARAQGALAVPALSGRVIDQTGTLGARGDELDAKLAAFEQASGPQIVILMVPTTQPEDITAYAYRVADSWKIGRRAVGDGVLVVVAKDDHKVRIEVAKALEGAIPDLAARQIIDRAITPAFKGGDYAGGLSAAIDMLEARIKGEDLPPQDASAQQSGFSPGAHGRHGGGAAGWGHLAILFFFGIFIGASVLKAILGRTLGTLATALGAAAVAWMFGASAFMAIVAGVFALVVAGVVTLGSAVNGLGGRRYGGGGMGGLLAGAMIGSALGGGRGMGGGGGFGGGGGGGFSSGGGGDFGGGGASGGW